MTTPWTKSVVSKGPNDERRPYVSRFPTKSKKKSQKIKSFISDLWKACRTSFTEIFGIEDEKRLFRAAYLVRRNGWG